MYWPITTLNAHVSHGSLTNARSKIQTGKPAQIRSSTDIVSRCKPAYEIDSTDVDYEDHDDANLHFEFYYSPLRLVRYV